MSAVDPMLNKVPGVTIFFWVIKTMCTTVGETTADCLNDNLGFGLTKTMGCILALVAYLSITRKDATEARRGAPLPESA
jgi:uncharacterized membrane-anchored protein